MRKAVFLLLPSFFLLTIGCEKTLPPAPPGNKVLEGPIEGLSQEELERFRRGDEAFNDVFTSGEGLGPLFVADQCASCHTGDGKGAPFIAFKRFGQSDTSGNNYLDQGGPQLQHKAIPGYNPETLPEGAPTSELLAPAVTGLGFLDAVPDQTLMDMADPNDANGDGISGRPHWQKIPDYVELRPNSISQNGKYIHRFGKKALTYDLRQQTAVAYNQDMGISSAFEPKDPHSGNPIDPEVSTRTINDVVFYLKTLKAPKRRNPNDQKVEKGEEVFRSIDCASCHKPNLKTGPSPIDELDRTTFHPYTDLLLHDMGPELNDGYTEGNALASEWRTPPLWGLGLSQKAQGGKLFLLHDGRANSIREAIRFHGGEAEDAKQAFEALSEKKKGQLIAFLRSL
ncbi:MAG: di-heme oxidoredictase family protein [Flavobacteriales bacterium]